MGRLIARRIRSSLNFFIVLAKSGKNVNTLRTLKHILMEKRLMREQLSNYEQSGIYWHIKCYKSCMK